MRPAILAALLLAAPLVLHAQEPDEEQAQAKEEARLLKKARRQAEDGEKKEALAAFKALGDLAVSRHHEQTAATAFGEALALAESDEQRAALLDPLYRAEFRAGDYSGSLRHCEQLAALKPDDATLANNLGSVLHKVGRDEEAVKAFERSLELDPSCTLARVSLGAVARLAGKPRKALRAHEHLIEKAKTGKLDESSWCLGFESAKGKAKAASVTLETEPQRVALVKLEAAIDHAFLDELDDAERIVARVKQDGAQADLGPALDGAIDDAERALELRPQQFQLRWVLALLYEAKGDERAEREELEKFAAAAKAARALGKKAAEKLSK